MVNDAYNVDSWVLKAEVLCLLYKLSLFLSFVLHCPWYTEPDLPALHNYISLSTKAITTSITSIIRCRESSQESKMLCLISAIPETVVCILNRRPEKLDAQANLVIIKWRQGISNSQCDCFSECRTVTNWQISRVKLTLNLIRYHSLWPTLRTITSPWKHTSAVYYSLGCPQVTKPTNIPPISCLKSPCPWQPVPDPKGVKQRQAPFYFHAYGAFQSGSSLLFPASLGQDT